MYTDKHSGKKYTQQQIDFNYSKSRKSLLRVQRDIYGYNFCIECKNQHDQNGIIPPDEMEFKLLDCSHIKSRQQCKNDSEIEKIWSVDNLQILCRHHHTEFDGLNLKK
jgi:hypothetical protein